MAGETGPPGVSASNQPSDLRPCWTTLPSEIYFRIINLALAAGQERDISALARTNKTIWFIVNPELHKLVVKHKTFSLTHWAAKENRLETLKFALAHGANPNQMRTSTGPLGTHISSFRPLGWNLPGGTDLRVDVAASIKGAKITGRGLYFFAQAPQTVCWRRVWFTGANLSTASSAQIYLLMQHYRFRHTLPREYWAPGEQIRDNDEARVVDLPEPLDDNFAFPGSMSPLDMDRRDIKISFVRLFQFWDTPLHIAAAHDRVSVTMLLLANGADVDCTATQACRCRKDAMPTSVSRPKSGNLVVVYTPLHVAICTGSYRVAKVLLAAGADRMARIFRDNGNRDWLGDNALHRALSWRGDNIPLDYNFIKFLLDQGYAARLEERNTEDVTPLQIACQSVSDPAHMDVVELLLQYGADPNSQSLRPPDTDYSRIPLHPGFRIDDEATVALWATRQGHFQIAKLLLDYGADPRARSSVMHETMLFAVCTARNCLAPLGDMPTKQWRMKLLDALLTRDTAKDLNTFYDDDQNLLMGLIRARMFEHLLPTTYFGEWESKLFTAGADIMAGADVGKATPFHHMIIDALAFWSKRLSCIPPPDLTDFGQKMLVILQASGIKEHRSRPRAVLNLFWGTLQRVYAVTRHISMTINMLPVLIRADFSPAEIDRHGDTAMTSFLKHVLDNPWWATWDRTAPGSNPDGWDIPLIMAILQENNAALDKKNDEGLLAFDYFNKIVKYNGKDRGLAVLRNIMRRSVRVALDQDGGRGFKFHPMTLYGRKSGDDTILRIRDNPFRWLACKDFCKRGYCRDFSPNWKCECTTIRTHPPTLCIGDCCVPPDSEETRRRNH